MPRAIAPGTKGVPAEVIESQADWPLPGHDYDNSRTASRSTITSANVDQLEKAWSAAPDGLGALSTAPIVIGDTVYLQGSSGRVAALDRATGKTRWISEATGGNIGPFGVAVGDGRVFADDGSTGVIALDKRSGAVLWRHRITATKTLGVDIQPTVFGGMVFASTVPVSIGGIYAPGDRGTIYALDVRTGAERWSFDTIKGELWGHPEINSGGGAWYPPAIDITRGVVYVGVANPAPFPGAKGYPNGTSRPGPNLYTDSVVALKADTGKLLWYYQVTPHDILDRDQVHVMLARTKKGRDVVVSAGKSGVVVALDRDSGALIWRRAVGVHQNDDHDLKGATKVFPGTYGGVLTPPATAGGVVYVATLNSPTTLEPDVPSYFGSVLGDGDGEVAALDADTGRIIWHRRVPGDPLGGAAVVNDLVLTALLDGKVIALARGDGRIAWQYDAGGGINGWMAAVDDTLFIPVGQASPPQLLALRLPR
jgi:outer membrane protein assembly factor BamB